MKLTLAIAFVAAVAFQISAQSPAVTFVGHDKVAEALAKGGPLATGSDLRVQGNHRMGPGEVEVHEKETDIFYVTDGEATVVTGGKMVGGRKTGPGQLRGTDVQGGESRRLQKGDVMVIPAGTPHWFKNVSPTINYLTIKVITP
jgi:glc operon protein GlcG